MGWLRNIFGGIEAEPMQTHNTLESGTISAAGRYRALEEQLALYLGEFDAAHVQPLAGQFRDASAITGRSPLVAARTDLGRFMDRVQETRIAIRASILRDLNARPTTADQSDIESIVDGKLDAFEKETRLIGIKTFMEHAKDIKAADDRWRQLNPDLATLEPLS